MANKSLALLLLLVAYVYSQELSTPVTNDDLECLDSQLSRDEWVNLKSELSLYKFAFGKLLDNVAIDQVKCKACRELFDRQMNIAVLVAQTAISACIEKSCPSNIEIEIDVKFDHDKEQIAIAIVEP